MIEWIILTLSAVSAEAIFITALANQKRKLNKLPFFYINTGVLGVSAPLGYLVGKYLESVDWIRAWQIMRPYIAGVSVAALLIGTYLLYNLGLYATYSSLWKSNHEKNHKRGD